MSWISPRNYKEVAASVTSLFYFHSSSHKITGQPMFVLSSVDRDFSGHRDNYFHTLAELQTARTERYLGHADKGGHQIVAGTRDTLPQDVLYIIARDNMPLMALHADGTVSTNAHAATGAKRYRDTITRLRPVLEAIPADYLKHFTHESA